MPPFTILTIFSFFASRDFECALADLNNGGGGGGGGDDDDVDEGKAKKLVSRHEPTGYAFCTKSEYFPPRLFSYRGPHAGWHFLRTLLYEKTRILKLMSEKGQQPMLPLSPQEQAAFEKAQRCYICNRHFHPSPKQGQSPQQGQSQTDQQTRQQHIDTLAPHLKVLRTYQPLAGDLPTTAEFKLAKGWIKQLHSDKVHQREGESTDDFAKRKASLQTALVGK